MKKIVLSLVFLILGYSYSIAEVYFIKGGANVTDNGDGTYHISCDVGLYCCTLNTTERTVTIGNDVYTYLVVSDPGSDDPDNPWGEEGEYFEATVLAP
jgi:hypothetical protein